MDALGDCAVALVLLWLHFNVEGLHWQVFPFYLALGLPLQDEEDGAVGGPVVNASEWA